jgi:hypothetical protein
MFESLWPSLRARWSEATPQQLAIALAFSSLVCATALVIVFEPTSATYPSGDQAVLEIYTRHAAAGSLQLGAYSRHLWHHPGPMLFYLISPLYTLAGDTELSLYVSALLINFFAICVIAYVLRTRVGLTASVGALALLTLYVARAGEFFVNAWNPLVTVLPFALLIVLCASVMSGTPAALPAAAALASFVVQTHVGYTPSVVMLSCLTVAAVVFRPSFITFAPVRSRYTRAFWLTSAAVILVPLWILPLAEQITSSPGNMTLIYRFFTSDAGERPALSEALSIFTRALSAPFNPVLGMAVERRFLNGGDFASVMIAASQLALLPYAWRISRRKKQHFAAALCLCLFLVSLAAFGAVMGIKGAVDDHQVWWISIVGLLNTIALFASVSERVDLWLARAGPLMPKVMPVAFTALLIAVGLYGAARLKSQHALAVRTSGVVRALTRDVRDHFEKHGVRRPLVRIEQAMWPHAAGVILQLLKQRMDVTVEPDWTPMFGTQMAASGREDGELAFAGPMLAERLAKQAEFKRIVRVADIFVFARVDSRRRDDP